MSFTEFNIDPRCLGVLNAQGITQPTPIQSKSIPVALSGRDVLAIAQTGTGKTLAFALPSLTRLAEMQDNRNGMLIITPTRELASQVNKVVEPLARALGLRSTCLYGGTDMRQQVRDMKRGVSIIVATPGRLLDHVRQRTVRLDRVSICVLDEADRMLDMGFLPDIRRILDTLPTERQTMMFSATFPKKIAALASDMQINPVRVEVSAVSTPSKSVKQGVYTVDPNKKMDLLSRILSEPQVKSALVFLRTKHRTDRVAKALEKQGFRVEAIHGNRSQSQRTRALEGFRDGRFNVLVATDVAARGIDVRGITHVVNFDIPMTSDDYIHRIGRTARASAEGNAITFVSPEDHKALSDIEKALGNNIPREPWEGAVHIPTSSSAPRNGNGPRSSNGPRNGNGPRNTSGARRQSSNRSARLSREAA